MALENNLDLESQEIEVEKRRYFKNSSWDYFMPTMTAGSTLFKYNEPSPMAGTEDHWYINFEFSATLSITSALFLGVRHTVLDYKAGLIDLDIARNSLIRDIKKSFYNLLLLKENIRIWEQNLATAERRYNQAAERYEYGLVPELDKLSAQVSYENLKPILADMRINYEMAVLSFKQVIGMDPEEDLELTGNIEIEEIELDISDFLGRIQDRLDIQAMKQQIEILENFRKVSIAAMMPVLTFSYTADPTFVNDPFEGGWFNNTEDEWVQQGGMFSITLSISLDTLLPRSKTWVEISQRDDEIRQANIALAQMIQMAQLEIESLVLELKKSMESISTLELNVRLAERAFELAESAYNAGNRDLLDVQNAELELQKAKLKVLEEKTTYISGILDLEYAINNPDQSYQVRE
jgi:outer membrane protein TolC